MVSIDAGHLEWVSSALWILVAKKRPFVCYMIRIAFVATTINKRIWVQSEAMKVLAFTPYTLRPTPSIAALPQKRSLTY